MSRRKKRYDSRAAEDYLDEVHEVMEHEGSPIFKTVKLRRCSAYHYQFWLGRRCLLNVWPSQRRFQLDGSAEDSRRGDPRDLVLALHEAAKVSHRKQALRLVDFNVTQAISCLSQFLLTQDETLVHEASARIQDVEEHFYSRGRANPVRDRAYAPEESGRRLDHEDEEQDEEYE